MNVAPILFKNNKFKINVLEVHCLLKTIQIILGKSARILEKRNQDDLFKKCTFS